MSVQIGTLGYYGGIDMIGGPPRSGATNPAGTTTTWGIIRNQMAEVIEALTPDAHSAAPFRPTSNSTFDFRTYAEEHAASVFREFEIETVETRRVGVEDYQRQMRETDCTVVVAYPHAGGLYATRSLQDLADRYVNRRALETIMEKDAADIAEAVGIRGSSNYVQGQRAARDDGWSVEAGDDVSLLLIPITVIYYHTGS